MFIKNQLCLYYFFFLMPCKVNKKTCNRILSGRYISVFDKINVYPIMITVTPRAACAPMTSACSISAVLLGPDIKQP